MKRPIQYKVDKEANKTQEIQFCSPASRNTLNPNHISTKINKSNQRKNMKDLENLSIKMDHQIMSTTNLPKTMSSLTARNNNPSPCQILHVSSSFPKNIDDHSLSNSALLSVSNNSSCAFDHPSIK